MAQVSFDTLLLPHLLAGSLSLVGAAAVTSVFCCHRTLHRDHSSLLIQIITICDVLYTIKYTVTAIAWLAGDHAADTSFHLFADNCAASACEATDGHPDACLGVCVKTARE
jgi:hypothetical protein